jgi:serine/threonine-protein kinase
MGSPKYMAPEQVNGEKVDARTDIYALGVIMYEMMTGKVPFDSATSVSILMAQVKETAVPMRKANPDIEVSSVMEEIVGRCLAKSPDDRFRSMDEVLLALKRVASSSAGTSGGYGSPASSVGATTGSGPVASRAASGTGRFELGAAAQATAGSTSDAGSFPSPLSVSSDGPASNAPLISTPPPRAGSKVMLLVAVLGALAVAGTIAFVALRPAPVASGSVGGRAAQPGDPLAAPPVMVPAASAPPLQPALVKVRINTDPDGASVKEDGVELCSSTPCDILYKGPDADPAREHKLAIAHPGYKGETRTVHPADGPVTVKLSKADVPRVVPQAPKVETPAAVPTGYKTDVPY